MKQPNSFLQERPPARNGCPVCETHQCIAKCLTLLYSRRRVAVRKSWSSSSYTSYQENNRLHRKNWLR